MTITSSLFEAFLKCPMKCWLRAANEPAAGNIYAEWVNAENESYRVAETNRMISATPPPECAVSPAADGLKSAKWRLASQVAVRATVAACGGQSKVVPCVAPGAGEMGENAISGSLADGFPGGSSALGSPDGTHETGFAHIDAVAQPAISPPGCLLETCLHLVERVPAEGRGKAAQLTPIRFISFNKLTRDDKLLLAYDAFVLGRALGRDVAASKIIHGDDQAVMKVKTSTLAGEVRKRIEKIAVVLSSPAAPDLILNRHCGECEFGARCRKIAIEKDDLSLLGGMSARERQELRSKGIFTVTQLSYTFRPRHRPKRLRDKREKYHHSLKALAIREKKIHLVGSPVFKIEGTPVYFDVEGVPDRDFYYLIGLRVGNGDSAVQHSLWADTFEDERTIWREFIALLEAIERPVLIHYGSYETTFLRTMCERYPGPRATTTSQAGMAGVAINLLAFTYGQVYFPTPSNGLKDVAAFLGFRWPEASGTGPGSIVWRRQWEGSRASEFKERLLAYNSADCEACGLLCQTLQHLPSADGPSHLETEKFARVVDHLTNPFSHPDWQTFVGALPELDPINKAAQWDYQRDRIYLRTCGPSGDKLRANKTVKERVQSVDKVVPHPANRKCPRCQRRSKHKAGKEACLLQEFFFGRSSLKRRTIRHEFEKFWCSKCRFTFGVSGRYHPRQKFGWNFIALNYFMTVDLGIPQQVVARFLERLFDVPIPPGSGSSLRRRVAAYYEETKLKLLEKIVSGHLVHADETRARKSGSAGYVWVFTSLREVVYYHSDSREADLVSRALRGFKGVLVSDFYAAYDSVDCPQQKCLIHLLRDLNDDILAHPYDDELKQLVRGFASLLKPMIDTIDRRGLKRHFLNKHLKEVDRFYKDLTTRSLSSEPALGYRQRFVKNREKLFTFLRYDGVPWNNNNAEHAIKAYTKRFRAMSCGAASPEALSENLTLLSICETCRCMGVDFLDFLRSGEKDIHAFAGSRYRRHRSAIGPSQ